jgi:hypothetical protein
MLSICFGYNFAVSYHEKVIESISAVNGKPEVIKMLLDQFRWRPSVLWLYLHESRGNVAVRYRSHVTHLCSSI